MSFHTQKYTLVLHSCTRPVAEKKLGTYTLHARELLNEAEIKYPMGDHHHNITRKASKIIAVTRRRVNIRNKLFNKAALEAWYKVLRRY